MMRQTERKQHGESRGLSRREFAGAAAAFTIVAPHVLGRGASPPPSERLNVAAVGIGGKGKSNLQAVEKSANIVALCDVDRDYSGKVFKKYPQAKSYVDFRKMLEMEKGIDAVIVATPDHTHAVIAMAAMKMGKHVFVQKPLTRTVHEARTLTEAARKYKVATQMGNQGHSSEEIRLIREWIGAGAIGDVREVHAWTNRPIWPQGIPRPTDRPPVPKGLDWDLWLGPAPERPYHPAYLPWGWRAWRDFGTGSLGDMACHILDPVFWALNLRYPTSVEACVTVDLKAKRTPADNSDSYPKSSVVYYEFPEREGMPAVDVTWYDGGMMPRRPKNLEPGRRMGDDSGGVLFVGEKGTLMCGCYAKSPRLIPETDMRDFLKRRPEKTIPRIEGSHEMDWVRACKGGPAASSNFDYSGPLTEMVVMGNLAIDHPGMKLDWDGEKMRVTNFDEANRLVNPPYREGWSL